VLHKLKLGVARREAAASHGCLRGEEKAIPRPRFPPRTWGTLRVFLSQGNCAVVDSDRLLKVHPPEAHGELKLHPKDKSETLSG
jgi:hypothetical protein